jgi:uncharacterized membrane protein
MDDFLFVSMLCALLGCGLMAGLFFAFSVSVMNGLARLPSASGIAAMQSINLAIINPAFLVVFLGTPVACVLVMIASLWRSQGPGAVYSLVGGGLYLVGGLLVTLVCNIPRNNALASVKPTDPDAAKFWAEYVARWTTWNHVRAAAALAATLALAIGLCQRG